MGELCEDRIAAVLQLKKEFFNPTETSKVSAAQRRQHNNWRTAYNAPPLGSSNPTPTLDRQSTVA
jgi:hypothetical protein